MLLICLSVFLLLVQGFCIGDLLFAYLCSSYFYILLFFLLWNVDEVMSESDVHNDTTEDVDGPRMKFHVVVVELYAFYVSKL